MKKLTVEITDVEVKLLKFFRKDAYESFDDIEGRTVEDVLSELDEVQAIQDKKPIAFFKKPDGSYILITKKEGS